MKVHIQTILNICLVISITFLVFQNNQLKDGLKTANEFAQLSVDKSWDRMNDMEKDINLNSSFIEDNFSYTSNNDANVTDLLFDVDKEIKRIDRDIKLIRQTNALFSQEVLNNSDSIEEHKELFDFVEGVLAENTGNININKIAIENLNQRFLKLPY